MIGLRYNIQIPSIFDISQQILDAVSATRSIRDQIPKEGDNLATQMTPNKCQTSYPC